MVTAGKAALERVVSCGGWRDKIRLLDCKECLISTCVAGAFPGFIQVGKKMTFSEASKLTSVSQRQRNMKKDASQCQDKQKQTAD